MLEYLDRKSGTSLYIQIYESLRGDILSGRMSVGEKLPSKRTLAEQLGVSLITVENAYAQLIAEGYVQSSERSGYYVRFSGGAVTCVTENIEPEFERDSEERATSCAMELFPFTVWARLMRTVILDKGTSLLIPSASNGVWELRKEIARYLWYSRGINVDPQRIIIGAGTEYLYNMLIPLLGRDKRYGVEDPGYTKLSDIYSMNGVDHIPIGLDDKGISCSDLHSSNADIVHISPAHHFPTGIVMPISRRSEIMTWAEQQSGRFIIEDDYDSEFRWSGKPVPSIFSMDSTGKVIYINTFSVTIAPSVRIAYMCLPEELSEKWHRTMSFCSCPVPVFEQYTLARFIGDGYFGRHISRMKKHYRHIRELVLSLFAQHRCELVEERSGLHFLAVLTKEHEDLFALCDRCGISLKPLSLYCINSTCERELYVVNYRNADEKLLVGFGDKQIKTTS